MADKDERSPGGSAIFRHEKVPERGLTVGHDDPDTIEAIEEGLDALLDRFEQHGVSEILDPSRPPVVRKKLFGIF